MQQLAFDFEVEEIIETIVVGVNKEIPLDVFKQFHHIAYFMELMERLPDGRVVWNPKTESIYSSELAEAEYVALQKDWFEINMELPKKLFEQEGNPE